MLPLNAEKRVVLHMGKNNLRHIIYSIQGMALIEKYSYNDLSLIITCLVVNTQLQFANAAILDYSHLKKLLRVSHLQIR